MTYLFETKNFPSICKLSVSISMLIINYQFSYFTDTFASKTAALNDKYADSSVGNVNGSNAVNVFLGIGLAWTIAAVYHTIQGTEFRVQAGSLGFSVTIFCLLALVCIVFLSIRRCSFFGGELGGKRGPKIFTGVFFISLWFVYVILASLENYCHIKGF